MNVRTFVVLTALCVPACSRPSPRPTAQRQGAAPATPAAPSAMAVAAEREAAQGISAQASALQGRRDRRGLAIMNAVQGMSAYPDTEEGARGFVTELARASAAHDRDALERLEREMVADRTRFELALDFEGARQLRDRVLPGVEAGVRAFQQRLGLLRAPYAVTVTSALGRDFSDGRAHGFNPAITTVRAHLRPAVRFHHVEVTGADGQRVVIEPMAFLAGRWTWIGEPWSVAPATPATPTAGPSTATR